MLNTFDLLINHGVNPRRAGGDKKTGGAEFHSHCPGCGWGKGGPTKSDRFQVYPARNDGRGWFICRQCKKSGDNIQFLREFDSMSYREACQELGITPKNGNTTGRKLPRTPRLPVQPGQHSFQPEERQAPADIWCKAATELVTWAHEQLKGDHTAIKWLANRGITMEMAAKYKLGFNSGNNGKALYKSRESWGLQPEKNEKTGRNKPLWLPIGWTIPLLNESGQVVQVRIRRLDEEIANFLPEMKYRVVPDSSMATMILNHKAEAFVAVENGFDACLVAEETGKNIGVVTTWNAQAKPDKKSTELLRQATAILIAYDFDKAGREGAAWWLKNFENAIRWPVPTGNDAGDAWAAGVNIADWVNEGLPPVCTICKNGDDSAVSSGEHLSGEGGAQELIEKPVIKPTVNKSCGLENDPELLELLQGLKKFRGFISISDQGRSMKISFVGGLTAHNRRERQRLADIVFKGAVVPFLLVLLPDGNYQASCLGKWAGRDPKKGYKQK